MNDEAKLCPFRKDGNGFLQCYGAKCMAYYEYNQPAFTGNTGTSFVQEYTRVSGCYQLTAIAPYSGYHCV